MGKALGIKCAGMALCIAVSLFGSPRSVNANIADICDAAAVRAARSSGIPVDVLRAISLTETGRKREGSFEPWPWTVNMEGKGVWFDTPDEALRYVEKHYDRGARSFDVGCFQINYRWHGNAFASIPDMFDPDQNAAYAARFLSELFEEFGDWSKAAGAYHSRTPKFADRYKARFNRIRASLDDVTEDHPIAAPNPTTQVIAAHPEHNRVNSYPLLRMSQGEAGLGSLVSLPRNGSGSSLFPVNGNPRGFFQ